MLPVDERADYGTPRVRLTRRGRLLVLLAVLIPVIVVVTIGSVAIGHALKGSGAKDYPGPGTTRVVIQVNPGDTATAIGRTLAAHDVVRSVGAFVKAAKADTRSGSIEPGFYALKAKMSGAGALALLLTPSAEIRSKVTIPEGTSIKRVLPLIVKGSQLKLADLQAAVAAPATLGLPAYASGSVEGFLFPATYQVTPDMSASDLLQEMIQRFETTATTVGLVGGAQALGYTPLQIVTIASIIERESAEPQNAAKVARVFYNRLKAGLPLGSEFTVNYTGNDPNSPYNTYTHTGFPPGPYDSPGQATLTAALHPAAGDWLYFVTLPKEGTQFATTQSGFDSLTATCKAEGGCT